MSTKLSLRNLRFSSAENLENNRKICSSRDFFSCPVFSDDGFIENQNRMDKIHFGARDAAYCGCGFIALWNILKYEGHAPDLPELIRSFEHGIYLSGVFGTSPFFLKRFIKKLGKKVKTCLSMRKFLKNEPEKGICYYMRPNFTAHYVAFTKTGQTEEGNLYRFYNCDICDCKAVSMKELFSKIPHKLLIFYKIE